MVERNIEQLGEVEESGMFPVLNLQNAISPVNNSRSIGVNLTTNKRRLPRSVLDSTPAPSGRLFLPTSC